MNRTKLQKWIVLAVGLAFATALVAYAPWYHVRFMQVEVWGNIQVTERTRSSLFTGPAAGDGISWRLDGVRLALDSCLAAILLAIGVVVVEAFKAFTARQWKIRILPHLALALFALSLALPAYRRPSSDWTYGWKAVVDSVLGSIFLYPPAICGAAANILFPMAYILVIVGRYRGGFRLAATATGLALSVLPMAIALEQMMGYSIGSAARQGRGFLTLGNMETGYLAWIAATSTLTIASGLLCNQNRVGSPRILARLL